MNSSLLGISLLLLAAALLVLGADIFGRERLRKRSGERVTAILARRDPSPPPPLTGDKVSRHPWLTWLESIGRGFSGSRLEAALLAPEDKLLLDQCGYNTSRGRAVFLAMRLVLAMALPAIVAWWPHRDGLMATVSIIAALGIGLLLPKFVLRSWARRLTRRVTAELPLLIDLLRVLQSVGLSMDQSLHTIAEQFRTGIPVLGKELAAANEAYAHGRSREQSLQRMADLFDNEELRSLTRMIMQVDQYGGAVQEPLRQFSDRLREQRKMRMKESVGKLSVKMTIVMMLTLLPALMLVLAGPAIIALTGALTKLGGH